MSASSEHGAHEHGVLIVGASVAGVNLARSLRIQGYAGPVRLLDRETVTPYDKPPLSKSHPLEPRWLLSVEQAAAEQIELVLGSEAVEIDTDARRVVTADGAALRYDVLVLATGARARPSPWPGRHIHVLRTLAEAEALHADLSASESVLVVGGGFIGAEVASAARAAGKDVVLVDTVERPLADRLGDRVAGWILDQHRAHGVRLRTGCSILSLADGPDGGVRAELGDGSSVSAGLAVVGIGAVLDTGWLAASGLPVGDGVLCDQYGRVAGLADVFAIGDVARWDRPDGSRGTRREHWTTAGDQARFVAQTITAPDDPQADTAVPYVWSDQHGTTIQVFGDPAPGDDPLVVENEGQRLALWGGPDGALAGAVSIGWPKAGLRSRRTLAAGGTVSDVLDALGLSS
ncbi:NAD(P)/FAD-dependent oxidoreductase [Nocardioides insulae]|uniref:NAD(P)/FAD-dependent oxidoreductase n=1 Tax=Nocardioides insulae TaxID=394734 RepID=UPI000426D468|nr:FAD-dependent oxidoreductase [Nocardioides insulae]